jgi:hypothetical protein
MAIHNADFDQGQNCEQVNNRHLTDFVARLLNMIEISLPLQEGEKALEHRLDSSASLRQGNKQVVCFFAHLQDSRTVQIDSGPAKLSYPGKWH